MTKHYERKIVDGQVAVVITGNYGFGWSTYNKHIRKELMYDSEIVELVEQMEEAESYEEEDKIARHIQKLVQNKYSSDKSIFTDGAINLTIEWIPLWTRFTIGEQDGKEYIITEKDLDIVA